jgi:hypothetical protein
MPRPPREVGIGGILLQQAHATLKAGLTADRNPGAVTVNVYPSPCLSMLRFGKVASVMFGKRTSLPATTGVVPESAPAPGLLEILMAMLLVGWTAVPVESKNRTRIVGVIAAPTVRPVGCTLK